MLKVILFFVLNNGRIWIKLIVGGKFGFVLEEVMGDIYVFLFICLVELGSYFNVKSEFVFKR